MVFKPELFTQEQVLAWYDSRENSCFIVFTGVRCDSKSIFSKWINEDGHEGRERLSQSTKFIQDNASNSNTYTVLSFPYEEGCESWKVKDIEGEIIRFQFHQSPYSIGNVQPQIIESKTQDGFARDLFIMMQKQNDMVFARFEQLEARLQNDDDDDDDDNDNDIPLPPPLPSGKERLMGALAGIVENPAFAETILTVGAALIGKLFDTKKDNNNDSI